MSSQSSSNLSVPKSINFDGRFKLSPSLCPITPLSQVALITVKEYDPSRDKGGKLDITVPVNKVNSASPQGRCKTSMLENKGNNPA